MLELVRINSPDDYFVELGKRRNKGVYFYRVNGYNRTVHDFILRYHEEARLNGVIIEGKIPNPDNRNLQFYEEKMGTDFQMDAGFINQSLRKWLPRMNPEQASIVTQSMYKTFLGLRAAGKNDNILKNIYIKFMCWFYYKFERIVNSLGAEKLPKILYEGDIGNYELLLMSVIASAGCDVLLLQYHGDAEYLRSDPKSERSMEMQLPDMQPFPQDFSLKKVRNEINEALNQQRLYGEKPNYAACTNAWMNGNIIDDIKTPIASRGSDKRFFYNCFCRVTGVDDKAMYQNQLYQLQLELKNSGRRMVIINNIIELPSVEEINRIHRANYNKVEQLLADLLPNLTLPSAGEANALIRSTFIDFILAESRKSNETISKLTSKAVYLICWVKRFKRLFENWKFPEVGCFFFMGGCHNENEEMFCRFLSKLPVDMVIFAPDLNRPCTLVDEAMYEQRFEESMTIKEFPEADGGLRVGTVAYHAERELDNLMYQDSGIYRNNQYDKANIVCLQTMYEEIGILWDQEVKFRPNFSTVEGIVNIPVIFAKVSGVKDGDQSAYWVGVKKLVTPDTIVIRNIPHINPNFHNPVKPYATEFFRNGKLQRRHIKEHPTYQYGMLREAMQEHILDKLQFLIDQKFIKGTFENGTEYTIVATILNMEKAIIREIQKFDFTKKNPKLIFLMTGENVLSLEDTILCAFLDLIGFDIVFFVPTGYQVVEKHFAREMIEEHQIGEFMYDLRVPDLNSIVVKTRTRLRDKIFKRGK
ncbi:MAG: hypothetical protein IJ779_06895 [Ruminococcus sp.]|nr:hypothetical protein [Ruminococcus sp.]